MNEHPPTAVPSIQVGVIPRYCASITGVSVAAQAMPSISFGRSPQSSIAFSAASACRPICDKSGMTPSFVVSAAPTTVTAFLRFSLPCRRTKQRRRNGIVLFRERHFQRHVHLQRLGRLFAFDDV